jgi:hypothetical protein
MRVISFHCQMMHHRCRNRRFSHDLGASPFIATRRQSCSRVSQLYDGLGLPVATPMFRRKHRGWIMSSSDNKFLVWIERRSANYSLRHSCLPRRRDACQPPAPVHLRTKGGSGLNVKPLRSVLPWIGRTIRRYSLRSTRTVWWYQHRIRSNAQSSFVSRGNCRAEGARPDRNRELYAIRSN